MSTDNIGPTSRIEAWKGASPSESPARDRSLHMGGKMGAQLEELEQELHAEKKQLLNRVQELDLELERVETMLKGFQELKALETRRNPPDTERRS